MAKRNEDIDWERPNKKGKSNGSKKLESRSPREDLERKKQMRKRAKRRSTIKRILASIFILIFILGSFLFVNIFSFVSGLKSNTIKAGNAPIGNEALNILVLGMDIGDPENLDNQAARRTDTMMLLNYNPTTKNIQIVSIPRDTLIEVEDAYDEYGNCVPYWKMNAAYALGGEDEVTKQVENLLDININYIVEIDYDAFRNFIDAIGGVEMYIEQDMYYDDDGQDLHINFKGGETVLLDGKKAEEFFRWRKNNDGTGLAMGDLGRIENQQKFVAKVIERCMTPSVLFRLPSILKVVQDDITTNMPGTKAVSYGLKFLTSKGKSMNTLEGYDEDIYGQSFLIVEPEYNTEVINSLKSGSKTESSAAKENYKIKVLNGTRVNGLAGNLQIELENLGYSDIEVGNADTSEKSIIMCSDDTLKKQLSTQTGINNIQKNKNDEYKDYDAVIVIGEDYLVFGD